MSVDREKLLRKAVDGDEFAQEELMAEYLPFIRACLQRLVGGSRISGADDIEDVASVTCVEAFQKLSEFEIQDGGISGFEAWLEKIARHRLYDARNREKTQKRGGDWTQVTSGEQTVLESVKDVIDLFAADPLTASRKIARNEAHDAILSAMEFLRDVSEEKDRHYYDAFRLHFIEGHTIGEVAELLSARVDADAASGDSTEAACTEGSVRNLLRTACNLLREHLGSLSLYLTRKS